MSENRKIVDESFFDHPDYPTSSLDGGAHTFDRNKRIRSTGLTDEAIKAAAVFGGNVQPKEGEKPPVQADESFYGHPDYPTGSL